MEPVLYQVEDGWIETFQGHQFYFRNPTPESIDLLDICHSLAMQCRYCGHTKKFYSVAEHSVMMARWMLEEGYSIEVALQALFHDAAEAYISDIPRPVKVTLPSFKELENLLDEAIFAKFNIRYPFDPIIKEADSRILVDERAQMMRQTDNPWATDNLKAMEIDLQGWLPEQARREFYLLANRLFEMRGDNR